MEMLQPHIKIFKIFCSSTKKPQKSTSFYQLYKSDCLHLNEPFYNKGKIIIIYVSKFNVIAHLGLSIYDQLICNKIQNITEGLTALASFFMK